RQDLHRSALFNALALSIQALEFTVGLVDSLRSIGVLYTRVGVVLRNRLASLVLVPRFCSLGHRLRCDVQLFFTVHSSTSAYARATDVPAQSPLTLTNCLRTYFTSTRSLAFSITWSMSL